MSKALEALERLYKSYEENYFAPFPTRSDLDAIKQEITPPTAEEVCEKLSEDFEFLDWKYDNKLQVFWGEHIGGNLDVEEISLTVFTVQPNAKTITLIGRFYEHLELKGK